MYELILSEKAREQLKKLPENIRSRIGFALDRIKFNPFQHLKRLVGVPYHRLRLEITG